MNVKQYTIKTSMAIGMFREPKENRHMRIYLSRRGFLVGDAKDENAEDGFLRGELM